MIKLKKLSKLDDKFMGYKLGSKAYRFLVPITSKLHISRNFIFYESKGSNWDLKEIDYKGGEIKLSFGTNLNWED